ncbi:diguanylate cyclase domain-containing protein [Neorhizobium galegae]|uniref:diguanylate cyclase domain-containing protein n=1 Tax=Neorhizobium galegae TaxID=399 RepID=UPI003AF1D924
MGGEEFAILLPGTGIDAGRSLPMVSGLLLPRPNSRSARTRGPISASFGITTLAQTDWHFEDMLLQADSTLSKRRRRVAIRVA